MICCLAKMQKDTRELTHVAPTSAHGIVYGIVHGSTVKTSVFAHAAVWTLGEKGPERPALNRRSCSRNSAILMKV